MMFLWISEVPARMVKEKESIHSLASLPFSLTHGESVGLSR